MHKGYKDETGRVRRLPYGVKEDDSPCDEGWSESPFGQND